MKYRLTSLLMFFLLSVTLEGQVVHAPMLEQCRADERLWTAQLIDYYKAETETMSNHGPNSSDLVKVSFKELSERSLEMGTCVAVEATHTGRYMDAERGLQDVMGDRFAHFIERHGLMSQFLDEDAAGKR